VGAISREWLQMVQLEIARLAAPLTACVDIRAACAVSPMHLAPHGRRNISTALARLAVWRLVYFRRGDALARCIGRRRWRLRSLSRAIATAKHPLLERCYEQLHRFEMQLSQRELWLRSSEQRLGPLNQLHVLFRSTELHLKELRARHRRQVGRHGPDRQRLLV
jgi:hypothetical protein